MNLEDLEALLWLTRSGSLQAAAQASGVPRTTLRRRLARLEGVVGESLVTIGAQGVKLSPAGELLAQRAPRLLSQREALLKEAQHVARSPVGSLRILVSTGFPPAFIAQVLASVAAGVPQLALELHQDLRPLDRLDEGFDLVVHWGKPPPPRDGFSRVLLRQPLRLMASPAYLEAQGRPACVEDLSEHALLLLASETGAWPLLAGGEVPVRATHIVDDLYLLGCLAGAGMGIALVPRSGVAVDASIDALQPLLETVVGTEQVVRVFVPTRTRDGGAQHALLERVHKLWGDGDDAGS